MKLNDKMLILGFLKENIELFEQHLDSEGIESCEAEDIILTFMTDIVYKTKEA